MGGETWVVDFETQAIRDRPAYPPEPVGVAVGRLRGKTISHVTYTAWGHPYGNSSRVEVERCQQLLGTLWGDPRISLVFHNAKFDLDVAETHLGLPLPPPERIHDTLFQVYLDDPRAPSLSLKPSAQRLLGEPPDEQDAVRRWLEEHGIVKRGAKDWGSAIALAPPSVVGPYALGDIGRTGRLHHLLYRRLVIRGMLAAYQRELQLLPVLLANERQGIRVDLDLLTHDVHLYTAAFEKVEAWLRKRLGARELDLDKDEDLADALDGAGLVDSWKLTDTGKRSTSKKNLQLADPGVQQVLAYRAQLATCLRTFMGPWLIQAHETGGWLYTHWNQVRGENDLGTRTGRLSSNPSKMNIPNPFKILKLPLKLPALPECRRYIIGDEDNHLVLSCDYSQQELRALGHFEDGPLLEAYQAEPRMDVHDFAQKLVNEMLGTNLPRKPIKNMGFGLIYGMGLAKLAAQMEVDEDMAKRIKRAYLTIFPGLRDLQYDLKQRAKLNQPIRTWGGREYFCELPKMMKDPKTKKERLRTFEYKLLNVLIQGSSADCTKEAMLRYDRHRQHGRFMLQVHDQLLISVPRKHLKSEARLLRDAMESVEFDVSMLVDASAGLSWAELEDLKL